MSCHHILVLMMSPRPLIANRSILWPFSHEAVPPAIPRVKAPIDSGQGLRDTI